MSLYKRGRVWWSRIVRSGETFVRSTKCKNRADAIRVEAQWLVTAESGNVALRRSERLILAQFETRFFEYIDQHVAALKTRQYYKTHWVPLRESSLGGMDMSRIGASQVVEWVTARSQQVGPSSVNASLRTLRRALRLAHEWGVIKSVPKIRMVKGERSREFVVTDEVLGKMLAHEKCTPALHNLLPFLIDTGLRLNEAMSLSWHNCDLKSGSVSISKGKSRAATRIVPLTARARNVLTGLKEAGAVHPFDQSSFTVSHQFLKLRDALKLPEAVLHSFRHTFCTRLGEAGVDAFTLMRLAGHSNVSVSQRYVHPSSDAAQAAIKRLG
jgi:integrase